MSPSQFYILLPKVTKEGYDDAELLLLMSEDKPVVGSEPMTLEASLVEGHADRFIFAGGEIKGITGYFERGNDDRVKAVHLFARRLPRLQA